ncbi:right-handed parallel beta-helix repeat-containing protein [Vibrio sp. 2-Bac 85]
MNLLTEYLKLVFTIFLIFISYGTQASSSYEMPVGIPNTTLDFQQEMPLRPSDWSIEKPGYYYINYQTGSDKQTYGTPDAPRKSFPNPVSAGSYIEIAGEYNQGFKNYGSRIYSLNGTDAVWSAGVSGPVWVTKAKDAYGVISKLGFLVMGTNVFISDLDFINSANLQIGSPSTGRQATNIVARNLDLNGGGISVSADVTAPVSNVVIYNSTVHDLGDVNSLTDDDNHIISVGKYVSDLWILDNVLHTASGGGLQILGDLHSRGSTRNIYAGNNEVYNTRQAGLWVKSGSNVIFSSNHIHDLVSTPWSPSKGLGGQYLPDELWMINNHIHGVEYGIRIASTNLSDWTQKIYMIGNVIHDVLPKQEGATVGPIENTSSWQSAAIHVAGAQEFYIYNNLIFDAPNGIDSSSPNLITIKNNVILDVTSGHIDEPTGYHIMLELAELNDQSFVENNYFGDGMNVLIREGVRKALHETVSSLNSKSGASGNIQGANIITQNNIGSIMDALSIDGMGFTKFKDAGTNVNDILITRFKSLFPSTSGINSDIFEKQRNLGNSIDIGPFEQYGVKQVPTIPTKPGELTLFQLP